MENLSVGLIFFMFLCICSFLINILPNYLFKKNVKNNKNENNIHEKRNIYNDEEMKRYTDYSSMDFEYRTVGILKGNEDDKKLRFKRTFKFGYDNFYTRDVPLFKTFVYSLYLSRIAIALSLVSFIILIVGIIIGIFGLINFDMIVEIILDNLVINIFLIYMDLFAFVIYFFNKFRE